MIAARRRRRARRSPPASRRSGSSARRTVRPRAQPRRATARVVFEALVLRRIEFDRVRHEQRFGRRRRARGAARDRLERDALVGGVLVDEDERIAVGRQDKRVIQLREARAIPRRAARRGAPSKRERRRGRARARLTARPAAAGSTASVAAARSRAPRRSVAVIVLRTALDDRVLVAQPDVALRRMDVGVDAVRSGRRRRARRTADGRSSRTSHTPPTTRRRAACVRSRRPLTKRSCMRRSGRSKPGRLTNPRTATGAGRATGSSSTRVRAPPHRRRAPSRCSSDGDATNVQTSRPSCASVKRTSG